MQARTTAKVNMVRSKEHLLTVVPEADYSLAFDPRQYDGLATEPVMLE